MARATSEDIRRLLERAGWLEGPADAVASSILFDHTTRDDCRDGRTEALVELATQIATKDTRIRGLQDEALEVRQRTARWEDVIKAESLDDDAADGVSVRDVLLREMSDSRVPSGWVPPADGLLFDATPPKGDQS